MSDESDELRLTRRKLLGGVTTIGVASALGGVSTWATFRDEESSTDNSVQAGTLDLVLSDSDETEADGVSGEFTLSNAKPGDTLYGDITLENAGSLDANHVELAFSYDENEADSPNGNNEADTLSNSADGMAKQFEVTQLTYDGTNIFPSISDANGNGRKDIADLTAGANDSVLDGLTPPPSANGGTESLFLG
ncbi:CalY family protein [Halococcus dombrowskii]|uniref:CalY family protein n=1 Tax=Halococcus dombrowskii TaxID=179637 RepID=A0AAV3SG44_HALDO|nr:TasA family protein [Halococcus dombrowskii]UOO94655.1 CalY family protein [Halococcus dombrowskii]